MLTGAAFGFLTQMYTNALRKMPLTRYPWEYVILSGLGATGGYYMDYYVQKAKLRVAELQAKRAELAKGPPRDLLNQ